MPRSCKSRVRRGVDVNVGLVWGKGKELGPLGKVDPFVKQQSDLIRHLNRRELQFIEIWAVTGRIGQTQRIDRCGAAHKAFNNIEIHSMIHSLLILSSIQPPNI